MVDTFAARAAQALASGDLSLVPDDELTTQLTLAARLFAAKKDAGADFAPVVAADVTPTDVVVTVTGMIHAAGLNLWDLSMWVSRPR